MPGQAASLLNALLAERERRNRARQHALGPRYDWYGPDCGCPPAGRLEDGSCPDHPRARANQRPPDGDWRVWGIVAGRGFGKTKSGAQWVISKAERSPKGTRIAIVAPISRDVRKVMIEGPAGILACSPPWFRPEYYPSKCEIHWPNGVIGDTYAAEEPDRLRGHNSSFAWCDEIAAWGDPEVWDMLMFGLRIGEDPQAMFTTTPRPFKWLKRIYNSARTVIVRGSTYENRAHLAPSFIRDMEAKYAGTKLGRQELFAEDIEDVAGALWTSDRIRVGRPLRDFERIVVAVDPTSRDPDDRDDDDGDEAGIVVAGLVTQEHPALGLVPYAYVLDDRTIVGSPREWAQAAIDAYEDYAADLVVAEVNNGGDMVRATIHAIDPDVPFKKLWASRGKAIRAEPVAALYEQARVFHCREFPELEAELTTWVPRLRMRSPNRLDALVWVVTELILEGMPWSEGPALFVDDRGD
jgi:phage terminase large subunit-like protein